MQHSRTIFLPASSGSEKVNTLIRLAQDHFDRGHHLTILVTDNNVAEYVDKLLWKAHFLPHGIDSDELISITTDEKNWNQSVSILNLKDNPVNLASNSCSTIYELNDTSTSARAEVSKSKYAFYREKGIRIAEISLK